ncbi:MAG: pseudouridine synthase [Chthoniobacterales bacterium]
MSRPGGGRICGRAGQALLLSEVPAFANIAAYKFASLAGLKPLRERLLAQCRTWGLKGTILLSTEGINLFVAGQRAEIDALVVELHAIPGLEDLAPKFSESEDQPFTRMLVRIKKEIISFGVEGIDPARRTSPKLTARTLKQWLDEGRGVTLLDTRNDYEVKLGTFKGARTLGIDHFRQFPAAVGTLPAELKRQPVVMFCTGGIRCEKAGPFMEREGFENVFQLEGGILKYFEEVGGAHYDGECFVFDQRVGVDPALNETGSAQCFVCQSPLTEEEQSDPRHVVHESCPYCFKTPVERMAEIAARRQEMICVATHPLPGSEPRDNRRPINVPPEYDRAPLLELLTGIFPHMPRETWIARCASGLLLDETGASLAENHPVAAGRRVFLLEPAQVEPEINPDIRIVHEDEAIIVLEKPAPLPMHPCGRFHRNTLQKILHAVYAPQKPQPAHRLDANTTGLVVCSRTRHFARQLQPQFEAGDVKKNYLVRAQGHPERDDFSCNAGISDTAGEFGSRAVDDENGLPARTHFRVLERFADGTSLLEARPITGRTNQIRIHLWQLGLPVCGDRAYLTDAQFGEIQTLAPGDRPLCLHAWKLAFRHPVTDKRLSFETEKPAWARMES